MNKPVIKSHLLVRFNLENDRYEGGICAVEYVDGIPTSWKSYKTSACTRTVKNSKTKKSANDFMRENMNMMFTYSLNKVTLFEIDNGSSVQYVPYNDHVDTIHMVGFL